MKSMITKLLASMMLLGSLTSCYVEVYSPAWYYNCYPVYSYWGFYLYDECYWEYYNQDGSLTKELDMTADVADVEKLKLEKTAAQFASKYNLSAEKGMQLAKNLNDFAALEDRTAADIADFSQRLYGINPSEVISAVGQAQVGLNAELDSVIEKAALNFNTDAQTMKEIIKDLHGNALRDGGINL
jgi:hypothetical protein